MNSSVIASSYATTDSMKYGAHYVTLVTDEVSYENPTGKFVMEYATPNTGTEAYDNKLPKNSTSNVVNKDNLGTTRITMSNYISLTVPKYLFYIESASVHYHSYCSFTRAKYYKGQKFLAINAGGNIDTPCIVGVV